MIRALAIAAAGAVLSAVLVAPANAAQPASGECIVFCSKPSSKVPRSKGGGCIFFCPQQHEAPKSEFRRHGGIEWGPTKRGECVLWCGEGYRQRKFHDPGPLFGSDWWKS